VTAEAESLDALLDRLDSAIARLSDSSASIEELATAYEEGLLLLARAEERLTQLAAAAGLHASGPATGG
jgi:exonuclease VII small subunit